jgi:uncharacterized damage-inducible protein DinB
VGEKETLLALLAFQRDTLRWKCTGLTAEQLAHRHAPSTLTLGGLLKHLAVVEAGWVNLRFAGLIEQPSWWAQYQQDGGEGWTFRTAAADPPEQLFAWLDESQHLTERVVSGTTDLDALAPGTPDDSDPCSLRWILLHLVQEYGRHLGHADLIREAIDGTTGV